MPILKKPYIGFTQVLNELLNDERISFKAKGLYAFLMSKPDGWDFETRRISKQSRDGVESVSSGLRELEKFGYLIRIRLSTGRMEYLLQKGESSDGEIPSLAKTHTGKTPAISNKEIIAIKNNNSNKEFKELQAEPANNINPLIKEFEEINPTINYGNKTQREACQNLIGKFGYEKTVATLNYYKSIRNQKFSPTITTPYQLQQKMGELINFYGKQQNDKVKRTDISEL